MDYIFLAKFLFVSLCCSLFLMIQQWLQTLWSARNVRSIYGHIQIAESKIEVVLHGMESEKLKY